MAGAESWPAYSRDGERLIYISESAGNHALVRQYYAGRPETLYTSRHRLSAPAARRDGILITFIEHGDDGTQALRMLLPVREMLVKTLIDGADLADQPIVWRDRNHYLVALDGKLEQRELAGRARQPVEFTAWLSIQPAVGGEVITVLDAAEPDAAPPQRWPRPVVLRAARLFDAATKSYRFEQDVLIEAGRIAAVVPRRQWPDHQVIDMGDASLLPGLIDIDTRAALQPGAPLGRQLLAAGVTTLARATGTASDAGLPEWPDGPRVIGLNTVVDVRGVVDRRQRIAALIKARSDGHPAITDRLLPDLTLGPAMLSAAALPASYPAKPLYGDLRGLLEKSAVRIVAGVTPLSGWTARDWQRLRSSRLFSEAGAGKPADTRPAVAAGDGYAAAADAGPDATTLPPALTLAAELITMQRNGQAPATVLAGATIGAADVLRRNDLGRIEVGALADIVVVSGDPLDDIAALIDPVAIISRGRFMSAAGLLDGIGDQ